MSNPSTRRLRSSDRSKPDQVSDDKKSAKDIQQQQPKLKESSKKSRRKRTHEQTVSEGCHEEVLSGHPSGKSSISTDSAKQRRTLSNVRKPDVKGVTGGKVKNAVTARTIHGGVAISNKNGPIYKSNECTVMLARQEHTAEWLKTDADVFIKTNGFLEAKKYLETYGHVTICGESGSGKSSIGRQLLREHKNSFKCHVIDKPADLKRLCNPKIVLVDDVFGRSLFSHGELKAWLKELETFRNGHLPKGMKMIFTSRKYILREASPHLVSYKCSLFRDATIIDLSTGGTGEKKAILNAQLERENVHLSEDDKTYIVNMDSPYGFPYACFLFSNMPMWHDKPRDFFNRPIPLLIESVEEFAVSDPNKFVMLLLVLLKDGQLDIANLKMESKEIHLLQEFVENKDVSAFLRKRHKVATSLHNSYLISVGDKYSFRHPTVGATVAYVIGKNNPRFLLEHCSSRVVCETVRIQSEEQQPTQGDEKFYNVILAHEYHDALISRFVSDIVNGRHSMIAVHQACTNRGFVEKMFVSLKSFCKENETSLEKLLLRNDQGGKFLYWSVLNLSDALCSNIIDSIACNIDDLVEGIITCCVLGNVAALEVLMNDISPGLRRRLQHTNCVTYYTSSAEGDEIVKFKNVRSILHAACYYGHIDIVKSLVEFGFSVNIDDGDEEEEYEEDGSDSVLHSSCAGGHVQIICYLLQKGACLEAKSERYKQTALHICCKHGHLDAVEKCLEKGANIEMKDKDGQTPLLIACTNGFLDIVKYLVQKNADVHAKDKNGKTAVLIACSVGHDKMVGYLREHGAYTDDKDNDGNTLLHFACSYGLDTLVNELLEKEPEDLSPVLLNIASVKLSPDRECNKCTISHKLIEKGADVNYEDEMKMTPLLHAAENGYMELTSLFLEKGACVNMTDHNGQTILHKLAQQAMQSFSRILREYNADIKRLINAVDNQKQTPLHLAARSGRGKVIQALLDNGANCNSTDNRKQTPLHVAAKWGGDVQSLLEAKADVNVFDEQHQTPLHLAAGNKNISVIQRLIQNGANVNEKDLSKQTPLHLAARWGSVDTIQVLIEGRANVHEVDDSGQTPFHVAAEAGNAETVELLLDNGANINDIDDRRQTALQLASASGDTDTIQLLLKQGTKNSILVLLKRMPIIQTILNILTAWQLFKPKNDIEAVDIRNRTALHRASESESSADAVRLLLEEKTDVDVEDDQKYTPLHIAAESGNVGSVQLLIDKGSDIEAVNIKKQTPLHLASKSGEDITVQVLLDKGAKINAEDYDRMTPLHLATENGEISTVKVLLEHEANINAANSRKQTPLHLAILEREYRIFELLLSKGANISALDELKQTPLHTAATQYDRRYVEILLENKADVHAVDVHNETPMLIAAECGTENNFPKNLSAERRSYIFDDD